jgi:hypothetical protein
MNSERLRRLSRLGDPAALDELTRSATRHQDRRELAHCVASPFFPIEEVRITHEYVPEMWPDKVFSSTHDLRCEPGHDALMAIKDETWRTTGALSGVPLMLDREAHLRFAHWCFACLATGQCLTLQDLSDLEVVRWSIGVLDGLVSEMFWPGFVRGSGLDTIQDGAHWLIQLRQPRAAYKMRTRRIARIAWLHSPRREQLDQCRALLVALIGQDPLEVMPPPALLWARRQTKADVGP